MLPRSSRISKETFPLLTRGGKSYTSPLFLLKHFPSNEDVPKIAVIVSKKVSKSAVARNTVRRRVYSNLKDRLNILKPGYYLISAKVGAEKLRGDKLEAELSLLLKGLEKS